MTVSVLLENEVSDNSNLKLKSAHGLSLHIESGGVKTLLDAGPNGSFAVNAETMGIDLSLVDQMIVSHAHSDHGGGLSRFLSLNRKAEIFVHQGGSGRYYTKAFNLIPISIGLNQRILTANASRIRYLSEDTRIAEGISILTGYPENFPRPESNAVLFEQSGGKRVPDRFLHEILLLIEEDDGFVVFTACSHSGITNMVDRAAAEIQKMGSTKEIKAVFGGFHLHNPIGGKTETPEYLGKLAEAMKRYKTVFYTGHCTGSKPYQFLRDRLGDNLRQMKTGDVINL